MAEITYGSLWQLLAVPHSPKLSVERTCRSKAQLRTRDRIGNMLRKSTESEMGCKLYHRMLSVSWHRKRSNLKFQFY